MKNTTIQDTGYSALPSLRVAFKNEEVQEARNRRAGKSKKQVERKAEPKVELPLFDDYRIKAKDHDPL